MCVQKESEVEQASELYVLVEPDHSVIPLKVEVEVSVETEYVNAARDQSRLIL